MSIAFLYRWSKRWRKIMGCMSDNEKATRCLTHIMYLDNELRLAKELLKTGRLIIGNYK